MNNPLLWIDPWGLWKRSAWNTAVNAFDYVSGVSSVNAMSIFNPVPENPLGTVDPIPEFKPIIKWITPILENIIQDIRDPNPGPQAPLDNITPNPGPQKPLHNITPVLQYDFDNGILKKAVTPPPDENAKGAHTVIKRHKETGKITNYVTYEPNPNNPSGFQEIQRTDTGAVTPHEDYNKKTKENIPTPHIHGKDILGGVRPANDNELPKGH